jgi:hypothetical protein
VANFGERGVDLVEFLAITRAPWAPTMLAEEPDQAGLRLFLAPDPRAL